MNEDLVFMKLDEVWTADEQKLGLAHYLYHRTDEVNPELQYYASYLEVESFEFGEIYYIPTDFVESREPDSNRINLAVDLNTVLKRTWARMPDFIAHNIAKKENLNEGDGELS
jgi:hypothetical protein